MLLNALTFIDRVDMQFKNENKFWVYTLVLKLFFQKEYCYEFADI